MTFKFFSPNKKFGVSVDAKNFCIIAENDVSIYDDIDSFIDEFRSVLLDYQKKVSNLKK